jgi:hypothetical protein
VRLYGFQHTRTEAQFRTTWGDLQSALATSSNTGFVLAVSGNKLMLDGAALESGQPERSFAQLLSAAGLASVHFSPHVTAEDFSKLARAFATAGSKSPGSTELKGTLGDNAAIRVNQVRFIAADSTGEVSLAAQLAAQNLAPEFRDWLQDPQKLLQLIATAERRETGGPSVASMATSQGAAAAPGYAPLQEEEVGQALRILAKLGDTTPSDESLQNTLNEFTGASDNIKAALREMLEQVANRSAELSDDDAPMLMRAAERLAIKFALERYERGDVKINAVHEMMQRMSRQMDTLRKVLKVHEDKLTRAGMLAESHADILDRQFWDEVPDAGKRSVLLSAEAACVPPRNVRSFVEELLECGDKGLATEILHNYCEGLASSDTDVQRKTAIGLSQLADLYAQTDDHLLTRALNVLSERMTQPSEGNSDSPLSAAFTRLAQEAGARGVHKPVKRVLSTLKRLEAGKPAVAQDLRARIGMENRLPQFIEEALQLPIVPDDLLDVLRETPQQASEHIAERFSRCRNLSECDRLVELVGSIGDESANHLRDMLRHGPDRQAAATIGLLSRVDPTALLEWLPVRLRNWNRFFHDFAVGQIASGNAAERGQILWELIDELDQLVLPIAIDEIGLSGDSCAAKGLLVLAEDGASESRSPLLRLKAIEALGRLRQSDAAPLLRKLVESRKLWNWTYPRELRIAGAQALLKIDPGYKANVLEAGGVSAEELALPALDRDMAPRLRYRRYDRVTPRRILQAVASSNSGRAQLAVRQISLNGALVTKDDKLRLGAEVTIDLHAGLRHIKGQVIMRRNHQGDLSFEIVDMDLEDRSKLRRLLVDEMQRT